MAPGMQAAIEAADIALMTDDLPVPSTSRFGLFDFDRDSDDDLITLSDRGDLEIWGNDNGAFRLLRPEARSSQPVLGSAMSAWASAPDFILLTSCYVVVVEPPDHRNDFSSSRYRGVRDAGGQQRVWRDKSLARPPSTCYPSGSLNAFFARLEGDV